MLKLSTNKKLNAVLNAIYDDLSEMGVDEIRRYKKDFPREADYNIAQHGNALVYYNDIYKMYRDAGYKSTDKYSPARIWETYKRQVGYIARQILIHENNRVRMNADN